MNHKIRKFILGICYILASTTIIAQQSTISDNPRFPPPSHDLYKNQAKGCRTLDLATWKHPTRKVLEEKYHFKIFRVQLCNHDKYPVFTIASEIPFNTQPNSQLAKKLFIEILEANAGWSYAIVETEDEWIYYINNVGNNKKKYNIVVEYDDYHQK